MVQRNQGQYLRSERSYLRSIDINPRFPEAHNDYAILLENYLNNFDKARVHYLIALKIDPGFELVHNNYGVLLEKIGDPKEARMHYKKAIEIDPLYSGVLMNLAILVFLSKMKKRIFLNICIKLYT